MGAGGVGLQEQLDMQDTTDWALDPRTGEQLAAWHNVTEQMAGHNVSSEADWRQFGSYARVRNAPELV